MTGRFGTGWACTGLRIAFRRPRACGALGVLAGVAALGLSAPASAGPAAKAAPFAFGAPTVLGTSSGYESYDRPSVALDRTGDAVAIWSRAESFPASVIEAFSRRPGNAWSPPTALTADTGVSHNGPRVAMDAKGDAVAVWYTPGYDSSIVEAASRPAGGVWSAPTALSGPSDHAHDAQLAVDAKGNAVVVWWRYGGSDAVVQAATRPAGGAWSAPTQLGATRSAYSGLRVAGNAKGDAVAVWIAPSATGSIVQAVSRPPHGAWSAPTALSVPLKDVNEAHLPQVALDAKGDAIVVWANETTRGVNTVVETASRPAHGVWSTPTRLSAPSGGSYNPHVALGAKGDAVVVWTRGASQSDVVEAVTRPSHGPWSPRGGWSLQGGWSPPAVLSSTDAGVYALLPQVAVDRKGAALAAWSAYTADGKVVQATSRPTRGAWAPPTALSSPTGFADDPQVAVNDRGDAAVVWTSNHGSVLQVATTG